MSTSALFLLILLHVVHPELLLVDPMAYQVYGTYQDKMVVIGGRNESINNGYIQYLDLNNKKADVIKSLNIPIVCHGKCFDQINNIIYFVSTINVYSVDLNERSINAMTRIPINTTYGTGYSCVTINNDYNLYVMGGVLFNPRGQTTTSDNVQKYSILTGQWNQMASMKSPRNAFTCEYYNISIYIFGGSFGCCDWKTNIDSYSETDNEWKTLNGIVKHGHTVRSILVKQLEQIIIVGGYYNNEYTNRVSIFNLLTLTLTSEIISINIRRGGVSLGYDTQSLAVYICGGRFGALNEEASYTNVCERISLTVSPTINPTNAPSMYPSNNPSVNPSINPTQTTIKYVVRTHIPTELYIYIGAALFGCFLITTCSISFCIYKLKQQKMKNSAQEVDVHAQIVAGSYGSEGQQKNNISPVINNSSLPLKKIPQNVGSIKNGEVIGYVSNTDDDIEIKYVNDNNNQPKQISKVNDNITSGQVNMKQRFEDLYDPPSNHNRSQSL